MKNLDSKIQVLNENKGELSIYEYVVATSESDPNFYRWLFDQEFDDDFDSSLSDEQNEEYEAWVLELKKEYLIEKYIVVSFEEPSDEETMKITLRKNFATMDYCEAYGEHGVKVGCYNAGCYTLENSASDAQGDCSLAITAEFGVCVSLEECAGKWTVNDTDDEDSEGFSDELIEKIEAFIETWKAANESHNEITGWTYHDSHNFKTIGWGENGSDCEELDNDEQIAILLQMPESTPYIDGTNADVETEDYIFKFDRWASNPWYCFVEAK